MATKIVYKNTITYTIKHNASRIPYSLQINTDKYDSEIIGIVDELLMNDSYENIIIAENILHQNEKR